MKDFTCTLTRCPRAFIYLDRTLGPTVVPPENSESMEKATDLSCPAVVSRACSHSAWRFFRGSLVGFAAAWNWSSRSLRFATN